LSDLTQVVEGYALRSRADPPPSVDEDHTDRQTTDLAEHHTTASILVTSLYSCIFNVGHFVRGNTC